jgi:hypothetical protein
MLEEVAPLTVVATVRYLDLLAIHIILNLIVPHPSLMRMISVNSLQKDPHKTQEREMKRDQPAPGSSNARQSAFCLWSNGASSVKKRRTPPDFGNLITLIDLPYVRCISAYNFSCPITRIMFTVRENDQRYFTISQSRGEGGQTFKRLDASSDETVPVFPG